MTTKIIAAVFSILFFCSAFGQNKEVQNYVGEGVKLYDNGDYNGAIEKYKKALSIDENSPLANYEIAMTYFAIKDYEKSIEHNEIVIKSKSDFVDQAYTLKGSALDLLGRKKEAIKTFEKAIKEFPNNHLLYFNLALTNYNIRDYKEAEKAIQKGLQVKPSHSSSHLLLSSIMSDQGNRIKSILALYNFLLLEPKGKRAKSSYEKLLLELKKGVKKENDTLTTITLLDHKELDEFSAAEMMISLIEASNISEKKESKTEIELFTEKTKSLFSILGELKKSKKGFWWNYYVDFYQSMTLDKHYEAFSYYISQSKDDQSIPEWLKVNKDKIDALIKWYSNYDRK